MGIEIETLKGWSEGRRCDYCKTASASAFCSSHSAFLCLNCDSTLHPMMSHAPHQRLWMCEVCEQAPAAVTCKADAAALCVTCDADIHCANPLARRHERVPIEPFVDPAKSCASLASNLLVPTETDTCWMFPNRSGVPGQGFDSGFEFDEVKTLSGGNFDAGALLEFDSVVPVQVKPTPPPPPPPPGCAIFGHENNCSEIDFGASKLSPYGLVPSQSISHSVSSSSVDVGVVPDGNSMSEISFPYINMIHSSLSDVVSKGTTFSSSTTTTSTNSQAGNSVHTPRLDREARVLRYREKRKNRKFEKTIRYASRKAYAETRPRIKGRFAKRTENEPEMAPARHRLFSSSTSISFVGADTQYGVVPTF